MSTSSGPDRRVWTQGLGRLIAGGLREPIVHFLLVGTVVFALFSLWGSPSQSRVVQVRSEQIEALRRGFELRRGRSPAPQEEHTLVEQYVSFVWWPLRAGIELASRLPTWMALLPAYAIGCVAAVWTAERIVSAL